MNSRFLLVLTLFVAGLCASAGSAQAAGCTASYSDFTHNVMIQSCNADPDAPVYATISRTAAGEILLDGNPIAGDPTVTNTNAIVYDGDGGNIDEVTLDMSNGRFEPGFTPESGAHKSAIEIDIDGGGPTNFLTILGMVGAVGDRFEVNDSGIDLDDDGDPDIEYSNFGDRLTVDAQGGDDLLYGTGFGSSQGSSAQLMLRGGAGDDQITGGAGSDELDGGDGTDTLYERSAGGFTLTDTTLTGNGTDAVSGFERATLTGDDGPQTIDASAFNGTMEMYGYGGSDTLIGGPLNDTFRGFGGDDTIRGGPGIDQVLETVSDAVLTDTTLTGDGTDTLESIERGFLFGTPGSDRMDASSFSGIAQLAGFQGSDVLISATGGGFLHGGEDGDELTGGPGFDTFLGGAGDDRIFSRDSRTENVDCGDGTGDVAVADNLDGVIRCEQIDRGGDPAQPGDGAGTGPDTGGTAPDTLAPALSGLTLSRHSFRAASSGAAIAASAVGTTVRFTLSESATVTFRIQRAMPGRRAGGACRAPSSRNRSRPACTRWVTLRGTLTRAGLAGPNKLVLRGRLGGRALAPGRYRLVALATDDADNRSAPTRSGFRILAR
jgi:Ca2+-binding RTX toxin-like protein